MADVVFLILMAFLFVIALLLIKLFENLLK